MVVRAWSDVDRMDMAHLRNACKHARKESECLSSKVGAVVVGKYTPIYGANITMGETPTCEELGYCPEDGAGHCTNTIHAEADAILEYLAGASDRPESAPSAIYITREPCYQCAQLIAWLQIPRVVVLDGKPNPAGREVLERHRITLVVVTGWEEAITHG